MSKYRVFFPSLFSCIWTEYRKIWTRKTSIFGYFSCSVKFRKFWGLITTFGEIKREKNGMGWAFLLLIMKRAKNWNLQIFAQVIRKLLYKSVEVTIFSPNWTTGQLWGIQGVWKETSDVKWVEKQQKQPLADVL